MPTLPPYPLALTPQTTELDAPCSVSGTLPAGLHGTLLRNGPGRLQIGPDPANTLNWFDGHGHIVGLTLADGGAYVRSRHVPGPDQEAEVAAGRILKRRLFTNHPSRLKNVAALDLANSHNHDVYAWGGKVVATNDPGHHALDGRTLADAGGERWGEVPVGHNMSPMPQPEPATGRLIAYVVQPGGLKPDRLQFVELDANLHIVKRSPVHALGAAPAVVHGHTFSTRWYIVPELPGRLAPTTALWGARTVFESIGWPPGATTTLVLVSRDDGRCVRVPLPAGNVVVFHLGHACDSGDRVVVDGVSYEDPPAFSEAAPPALLARLGRTGRSDASGPVAWRWEIDTATATVVASTRLGEGEVPTADPRFTSLPTRHLFVASPQLVGDEPAKGFFGFFHGVACLDASGPPRTWSAGPDALCSPPVFVPRSADAPEGDGWLLAWVEDGHTERTEVVVLDTAHLADGPVARITLGAHLPAVSHTRWAPDVDLRP